MRWLLLCGLSSCYVTRVEAPGLACDQAHPCAAGFVCYQEVCLVPSQVPDDVGVPDAGAAPDAAVQTTPPDDAGAAMLPVADAGAPVPPPDAGAVEPDAGRVAPDAGPPLAVWRLVQDNPTPSARVLAAMAFDTARDVAVLFGGDTGGGETWEWSSATRLWRNRAPSTAPSPRLGSAMTYDPLRATTVLFGGHIPATKYDDTWLWNGTVWARATPLVSPPGRAFAALAWDSARGRGVLFGGHDGAGYPNDTWEWDGAGWIDRSPPIGQLRPPGREGLTLTYDPTRQRTVLVGGFNATGVPLADVWEWDGTHWTAGPPLPSGLTGHSAVFSTINGLEVYGGVRPTPGGVSSDVLRLSGSQWSAVTAPPLAHGRNAHCAAWDDSRNAMLVFGGDKDDDVIARAADAWLWNGTGWQCAGPAVPSSRSHHAMAYDAERGVTVLFGGFADGVHSADTWEWDGISWTERVSAHHPSGRVDHALAYDAARRRVRLFGGADAVTRLGDLWEWDGTDWQLIYDSPTTRRTDLGLAFDTSRRVLIAVAGNCGQSQPCGGALEWAGTSWLATGGQPTQLDGRLVAFDESRNRLVANGTGFYTLEWDGQAWSQQLVPSGPPARRDGTLFYVPERTTTVLYGGAGRTDLWEWSGATWTELRSAVTPSPRAHATVSYDRARRRAVLFSGDDGLNDTWELEIP